MFILKYEACIFFYNQVSLAPLSYIIGRNTGLNSLKMSGCRNLHPHDNITSKFVWNSLYDEFGGKYLLEEVAFGWGFSPLSFENIQPSIKKVRAITLGTGASLSHQALLSLPIICPLLESVILNFQVLKFNSFFFKNYKVKSFPITIINFDYGYLWLVTLKHNAGNF